MSRKLEQGNFKYGMRRDAGLLVDGIHAMRTIQNYQFVYSGDKVRLKIRKGYSRWNSTAMAAPATQLFWFNDLSGNENLMGIVNSNWYAINESGAHTQVNSSAATAPQPAIQVGNRFFFCTDDTWRWTDNAAINGATTSYRVGIQKPSEPPNVIDAVTIGHSGALSANTLSINATTYRKLAIPFAVSTNSFLMNGALISLGRWYDDDLETTGSFRVGVYADDGGDPATSPYSTDAITDWLSPEFLAIRTHSLAKNLQFQGAQTLPVGSYWLVLEGDSAYYDNYLETVPATGDFFVSLGHEDNPANYTYGKVKRQDYNSSTWYTVDDEAIFYFHGISGSSAVYDYVYTYVNSTYGIESRPSDKSRITLDKVAMVTGVRTLSHGATTDGQVDKVRYYRRDVTNYEDPESSITDSYKCVGEVDYGDTVYECLASGALGAELQTGDHYCYDDLDDNNTTLRESALQPYTIALWKGRIIFAEKNGNTLYFTKRLEEDGRTGQTGDSIYDYIPLENQQEMPVPSDIVGIKPLTQDQLAVYFKDESVWLLRGMNAVLNPPPDIARIQTLSTMGVFAPQSLTGFRGRHVYMATDGVYVFNGSVNVEFVSVSIQSIFDDIELSNLDDTVMITNGNEILALVDGDNDGALESIYILDLQRREHSWRVYNYGLDFNDMIVKPLGGSFRSILAADADSNYILELESGATDNGLAIEGIVEPHYLSVSGEVAIEDVAVRGLYAASPASYQITLTNHVGQEAVYSLNPSDSNDLRGHHTGCRMLSTDRIKVKIQQWSVDEDEFRGFRITYQVRNG